MLESLVNKIVKLQPATLLKRVPTQVFSCEFCEVFNSTIFFTGNVQITASPFAGKNCSKVGCEIRSLGYQSNTTF